MKESVAASQGGLPRQPEPGDGQLQAGGRNAEQLLRAAFESVGDAVFVVEATKRIVVDCSPAVERVFGYRRDEVIGRNTLFLHVDRAAYEAFGRDLSSALEAHSVYRVEFGMRRKNGEIFPSEHCVTHVVDSDGRPAHLVSVVRDMTERRKMEASLRASEERYRALVEDQTEVISRFRTDGTILFANDVYSRFFGKTTDELIGQKWHPRAVGEDVPTIEAKLRTLSPANPVVVIENRVYAASGEVRWMQFVNRGFFDPQGRLDEIQSVGRDITERRRAEDAMRESEALLLQVLASAPDAVFAIDREYRLLVSNERHQQVLVASGAQPVRVGDSVLSPVFPPERLAYWRAAYNRALGGEQFRLEVEWKTATGEALVFENTLSPLREAAGTIVGCLVVARDITERKRAQAALQESEQRFSTVIRNSPVAIGISRLADGKFLDINEAFVQLYGYSREEIVGHTSTELGLWHSGNRDAVVQNLCEREGRQIVEMQGRCKDGKICDLLASIDVILLGGELCMVGFLSDITERKRLEMERAEAMARLAVVQEEERRRVARELHDQTAQRLVALAVELKNLETNLAAGRRQDERVQALRRAVAELDRQVRQVAFDLRDGEIEEGGLEDALRDCVEGWSERTGVPVECEFRGLGGERLPAPVEATLYRVAQEALANVQRHANAHRVSMLLERDGGLARLTVEDDGCGFDADAVRESSKSDRQMGLLGMRERVALAGGTLLIESAPGAGTTILVRVPIPAPRAPSVNS